MGLHVAGTGGAVDCELRGSQASAPHPRYDVRGGAAKGSPPLIRAYCQTTPCTHRAEWTELAQLADNEREAEVAMLK
jgi:hypothetical protein